MTRNLKIPGLILIAAFALTAVLASAAQAEPTLIAETETAILTGESISHEGKEGHVFHVGAADLVCTKVLWVEKTFTVGDKKRQTLTPTYQNCTYKTLPATVTMNGCDYELQNNKMALVCPAGNKPTVHVYANAGDHAGNKVLCTFKANPFTDEKEAVYSNTSGSPGDVHLTITHAEFTVTREGSILCGAAEQSGYYTGELTLKAYAQGESESEGSQVGLSVSPE